MANSFSREISIRVALGVLAISLPCAAGSASIATTLSIVSTVPAPYYAGQVVIYTATLGVPSGTPNGSVTFTVDGVANGTSPVDPSHIATMVLRLLAGTHSISASYSGDQNYLPSTSAT